jgi:hypothetical protein
LYERLYHSGYPRDDIGLKPACAKNPRTRPLPLEPGAERPIPLLSSQDIALMSDEQVIAFIEITDL